MKEYIKVFGPIVLVFGLIVYGLTMFESYKCNAGWARSGMATSWGPIQGCLVQVGPNRWIPSDRVRETDLPKEEK